MNSIIIPALAVGALGLAFGAILAFASIVFKVDSDERIDKVSEILPGANCGGCGYAGCSAFAKEIVENGVDATRCNLMTSEKAKLIADIMGTEIGEIVRKYAVVSCNGTCSAAKDKYIYQGTQTCEAAARLAGGPKACEYGCLGLGSCVNACNFGALSIVDGVACVDKEKCTGCMACQSACPQNLITMVPEDATNFIPCSSKAYETMTLETCGHGCIGCKKCEKTCPEGAIKVVDNLAVIDYNICKYCGECAEVCPTGCLKKVFFPDLPENFDCESLAE